jgi:hypothetical protein
MKIMKLITGLVIPLVFLWILSPAQDIELTASAKSTVQIGEQFRLTYAVNSQVTNFNGPDLTGFRILSGPNQSSSQSYQIINGKVAQSFQITFTYYLQAAKEGSFQILPATVVAGGKKIKSNALQISVVQSNSQPAQNQPPQAAPGQPSRGPARQGSQQKEGIQSDDVYIKAFVDQSSPYQGEQVIITYKIYTTVPISQISISKLSSFPGFWYKNLLNDNEPLKQYSETINGKQYVVADLRKIALYPQKSGEIKIEPMEMECLAQVKSQNTRSRDPFFDSFFDDPFFNRSYQNVNLNLQSNTVTVNVKALPLANKPSSFKGAVGNFTISSGINRTDLKTNEAITYKLSISGKGSLELIENLKPDFPPDFESYDPKINDNINKSSSGLSGSRTFEYLTIPRNAGDFQIKPVEFSYFDPDKNTYITLTTPAYKIHVNKGLDEPSGIAYSGVSQKNIQFIGSDVRYIKTRAFAIHEINLFFFASDWFYLLIIAPLILFISFISLWRYNRKRKGDLQLMKNRRATKVARQNLRKASDYLKENRHDEFYIEISRALWGYLGNKFNIPLSDLSSETVRQRLSSEQVKPEIIDEFLEVLSSCEYARFAPGDSSRKMNEIYSAALEMISKIERELK